MHGCQVWDNFEPDWPQLGKIWNFLNPVFSTFCLANLTYVWRISDSRVWMSDECVSTERTTLKKTEQNKEFAVQYSQP